MANDGSISMLGRLGMAFTAFWDVLRNPQLAISGEDQSGRIRLLEYLGAWYDGTVFLPWSPYMHTLKSTYRLYRYTRLLWNPVPNIVNFWAGIIYPGNLSEDGLPFEDNKPTAIPFDTDIDAKLAAAIAQIWRWGNFQANKSVWCRYGAMGGSALMELRDPLDSRKVYMHPTKPEYVRSVTLNPSGDVLDYALEWKAQDPANKHEYTYRKEVTQTQVRTYRDDKPYGYTDPTTGIITPAVVDHPYPFCPAVWVRHHDQGSVYGAGCIKSVLGTLGALSEINSMESRIDDQVGKGVEPITVFHTDGSITKLFGSGAKRTSTDDTLTQTDTDRESLLFLKAPKDSTITTVSGSLAIDSASAHLERKKTDFKMQYPEYDMYPQLRAMTQITGPAAEILLGDIANPVREVRANYDRQLIKACQMAVTMAGILVRDIWPRLGPIDPSREQYRAFDENSFKNGDLAFEIQDRPMIPDPPLTEQERVAIADTKKNKLGIPEDVVQVELGYPEKEVKQWQSDKQAKAAAVAAAMQPTQSQDGATTPPMQPNAPQQPPQQPQIGGNRNAPA